MTDHRLVDISLDDRGLALPTPEVEQERRVAIFDLLEENHFAPTPRGDNHSTGPFNLILGVQEGRLVFDIKDTANDETTHVILSLTPFRQVIKDYFAICESYFEAVKNMPPAQIEAIDMGRRGIHNEGAQLLTERLENKIKIDDPTARRLFTLISVLHFKG